MMSTEVLKHYALSRFTSLVPTEVRFTNPIKLLQSLSVKQWLFFAVGYIAWTWDACDFFSVSLTVPEIAKTFNRSNSDITWGITLVLMFRSVGAAIFGFVGDRYGRKWPFIFNNFLFIILELGTGFTQTYTQFLVVRALFGISMGGLYGLAASTALEDAPEESRGILSGIFQQGYAFGYLLATVFARALVPTQHGWRAYFWFCAGPPVLIILFRLTLPENDSFLHGKKIRESRGEPWKLFVSEAKSAAKSHWLIISYLVALMAGLNFMAHGSQDLYPTLLQTQFKFSSDKVTLTQVTANLGAMFGATVVGYLSQVFGRRLSIICACIVGGALIYPYTFVDDTSVMAPAFFEQACVLGAFGVIPIHLMELSPPAFRSLIVGLTYQLGNLASSASSTIEATIGERFPLPRRPGEAVTYNYGRVMCIFMGAVWAYILIVTFIGPEDKGKSMATVSEDGGLGIIEAVEDADGLAASGRDFHAKGTEAQEKTDLKQDV